MVRLRLLIALLTALPCRAQPTVGEQYLLSAINQERASRNLAAVAMDGGLQRAARLHAEHMVREATISHQFAGEAELALRAGQAGARFSRIAENVAEGPSVVKLHEALMNSPGHRANILDPEVDAVGISVISAGSQFYAVEDFASSVRSLTLEQQEAAVGVLVEAAGVELLPSAEARKTCALGSGYAGKEQPAFLTRFTTADLTALPVKLRARLTTGQEHRASVGACASSHGAFSEYRLAVLLYP